MTTSTFGGDGQGNFGNYGGSHLPPHLVEPMAEVAAAYEQARQDPTFMAEYQDVLKRYVGRPSMLYLAERLTAHCGGARIYLKREDLNHTGSHKINHCLGEVLLARRMGKKKVIAETGAGSHGVALATAATFLGLECEIHMGAVDVEKQHPNVVRMQMLGATVVSVTEGEATLKEAVDSAFTVYANHADEYLFCIGSVVGPHPYPTMVRDFQSVIGREARAQFLEAEGRLPHAAVACVGGGSNSMGLFSAFLDDADVQLHGVEPAGEGVESGRHAATMTKGTTGVLHGMATRVLQAHDGEPAPVHSIASGLDYPGVGPQHVFLCEQGRVNYAYADDQETLDAFTTLTRLEGIIPALESAHAVAHGMKLARELGPDAAILVNLSGRGDKDVDYVAEVLGRR
ncbi:tryptophan synthase subunit beta [Luteococcus sp. Sow4_B9]|uniref:tryptophan synthase subunit beta n=1 Tax=Luteococcus sp. Sow4_B9 TaxID=3438792 RepID=UPI003F94F395